MFIPRFNPLGVTLLLILMSSCVPSSKLKPESSSMVPEVNTSLPHVERHPDGIPIPTLLAKRGEMMVEDDCSVDRRRGLGFWSLSVDEPNVCRVTHDIERKPIHVPIASYRLPDHENVIVEVTFRWGEPLGGKYNAQVLGIFSDLRPNTIKGHKIESWISGSDRFTKPGLAFTSSINPKVTMDEQPFDTLRANTWYTAVLEVVGNEALLRMGDRVAYVDLPRIAGPKNKITLIFGTTWHEIKNVRIWHATANPKWNELKDSALKSREAFTQGPFSY
ncbi:hypothetical protein [Paraglaciecola sp.]|uniref:hypothetical protein n=1 Tax=Paraglaciecola sp. TaxID=1920173 RepID=UPI003EF268DD